MHKIIALANLVGIKLKDRCSSDSWVYDGNTIALRKTKHEWYLDHDILHEIGHFLVASPDQRLFPEFGLKIGVSDRDAFGEKGGEFRYNHGGLKYQNIRQYGHGLIDVEEQDIQEFTTQQFCIKFGIKFDVSPNILFGSTFSWVRYMEEKTQVCKYANVYDKVIERLADLRLDELFKKLE